LETKKNKEINGIEVKNHINYFLSCDQMLPMIEVKKIIVDGTIQIIVQPMFLGWGK